ncbi:MAG: glycoside hydrolase family 2 TIM barrel-domain containing protein [Bacteroidota bacterium]|nr:glycoside hydrolase family 2 TIM barrel-domain containing protein [Bacteroidota bacterium]
MKKLLLILSCVWFSLAINAQRVELSVNESWKFLRSDHTDAARVGFDDSAWKNVNLPHTWNDNDVMDDDPGYYRGIGWYRKNLFLAKSYENKQVYLYFEGVNQETSVYVNGRLAGSHWGGYTAFSIDISSFVQFGAENLVAIKVDNKYNASIPPLSADFSFYGGIYRDVNLIITEKTHFDLSDHGSMGVFIKTPTVTENRANVLINAAVTNNSGKIEKLVWINTVRDANRNLIATSSKNITIKAGETLKLEADKMECKNPNLWSPENPYLYSVTTQLLTSDKKTVLDEVVNPLGFRWFSFDANTGFSLNGKHLKLIGANRHQDYYAMGNALPDEMHVRDMQLLKDMGANFVRLAHYPHNPVVYQACDRLGLIVWAEIPIVNDITPTKTFADVCKNMQTELIRQQFNHPSILMWGYMNEVFGGLYWGDNKNMSDEQRRTRMIKTVQLAKELDSLSRVQDPSRVTVMAIDKNLKYDEFGMSSIPQVLGFNLYCGWYYDEFPDFGKYIDMHHKMLPDKPFIISEYGAGSYQPLHSYQPIRYDHSMEWQEMFIESYYRQIMERPFISGASQWNFVDFVADMRGDYTPHYNNKGILTSTRQKKSIYWFYQASLTKEPVVKFALNGWTNRIGLAASLNDNFSTEHIKVYTNADKIDLFDNGKLLGTKVPVNSTAVFDVPMNDGTHQLVAKGNKTGWKYECADEADITMKVLGKKLDKDFSRLAVNLGSTCWFTDPESNYMWIPDKPYEKGGYGWLTADTCTAGRSTLSNHVPGSGKDPIFQTMRTNISGFKFDVPDGNYELEILFVYPFENTAFDIFANNRLVFNFDESKQIQMAVTKKIAIKAEGGKGVEISLKPIKGKAFLNGVNLTKIPE